MDTNLQPVRKWNPWPVSIIVFFAVAIASCAGFVVFCSMQRSELVAPDYYEQEIRYNSEMDRVRRARALNPPAQIAFDASSGLIFASIPPAHVKSGVTGEIELYRSSSAGMDRHIVLKPDITGRQVLPDDLAPGPWDVKLCWKSGGEEFQLDQKVVIAQLGAAKQN